MTDINTTCMICEKESNIFEFVSTSHSHWDKPDEIWSYCEDCKTDTFHPLQVTDA